MTMAPDRTAELEALTALEAEAEAEAAERTEDAFGAEPPDDGEGGDDERTPVRVGLVALAAALSTSSAAWMVTGLFKGGVMPRLLALVGVAIGVGGMRLSYRLQRPTVMQYLLLPAALVVGAVATAPAATGGSANLPGLVGEALKGGGFLQAPVPFDPGWRFLLVVFFTLIGAAAVSLPVANRRPKLAVLLPLPIVVGAGLLQPAGSEVVASMVAVCFIVAALGLSYGADLASEGSSSAGFEARRLARGAAMLVGLLVFMVVLSQTDFLFPDTEQDQVIPPRKPPQAPLEKDRELFVARVDAVGPWRVGVLDVYEDDGWMLPSIDPRRLIELEDGRLPPELQVAGAGDPQPVTFELKDLRGRTLPVPAGFVGMEKLESTVEYDPRIEVPSLEQRIPQGYTYTVLASPPPTGKQMAESGVPAPDVLQEFTELPPAPAEVVDLLAQAPPDPFNRLQFLRDHLYRQVIAAGAGSPIDITPARVAAMLRPQTEATPYEITAAEAMLARWGGVPARIGFGYYGGDRVDGGFSLRPRHGAAWLEAYFEGYGWVPLVGTPPQAKSSDTPDEKQQQPLVKPSEELAVTILVPVEEQSFMQLYQIVRYWVLVALPFLLGLIALVLTYPIACKMVRSGRRRKWALTIGPLGRIAVDYAEMRDRCYDLNLGDVRDSPLEFVRRFDADAEHHELGWLVTRALWGDLRRDLRNEDADEAEELARSVSRRIEGAQTATNRFIGLLSRASLRDPYIDAVPNFWPRVEVWTPVRRALRSGVARVRRLVPRRRLRPAGATTVILAVLSVSLLGGCVKRSGLEGAEVPVAFPAHLVPEPPGTLLGVEFRREAEAEEAYPKAGEKSLVGEGRVYSIRDGDILQGTIQVARFRPDVEGTDLGYQARVERALGGVFRTERVGTVRLRVREEPEQRLFVWFLPDHNVMVSFVMRRQFGAADRVVRAVVGYSRGVDPEPLARSAPPAEPDAVPPPELVPPVQIPLPGEQP